MKDRRISFKECFVEHLLDIIKNGDYDRDCVECRYIIRRLNRFLEKKKEASENG